MAVRKPMTDTEENINLHTLNKSLFPPFFSSRRLFQSVFLPMFIHLISRKQALGEFILEKHFKWGCKTINTKYLDTCKITNFSEN